MATALFTHRDCLSHVTPPGHPERVERLEVIERALAGMDGLDRREAPKAPLSAAFALHDQAYVEKVAASVPEEGYVSLDADTHLSPGSLDAALRALGGALGAVDAVMSGEVQNAFVATRPPGHHAETATPMGFCLFGNVALAAKHALDHHGVSRVAMVDFDVHHGNGTQDLLWTESRALFFSSHQSPLWPGTGNAQERGAHNNVHNIPLAPLSDGAAMRAAYEARVFPELETFAPELILISAGFDAHMDDPLANLMWRAADFEWLTDKLCDIAANSAQGRVVSVLEGGYDLEALGDCVAAHVKVLKERAQ